MNLEGDGEEDDPMTGEAARRQRKPEEPAQQERRQQERRQREETPQQERRQEERRCESTAHSNMSSGADTRANRKDSERSLQNFGVGYDRPFGEGGSGAGGRIDSSQRDMGQTGQIMKSGEQPSTGPGKSITVQRF